ncbi:MAG: hypothetical protein WBR26_23720 [Candidatus Acidiferrum sp.]
MPTDDEVSRFYKLFRGNSVAHYHKKKGRPPCTVRRGISLGDVHRHLRGVYPSLLSVPTNHEGISYFGGLDIDAHGDKAPVDIHALALRVAEANLPLVACRSTNQRGVWLFLFLEEQGCSSAIVRAQLEWYASILGVSGCEVFPKQDSTAHTAKGCGSAMNLPYHGMNRRAFNLMDGQLDLQQFLDYAELARVSAAIFETHCNEPPARSRQTTSSNLGRSKDSKISALPVASDDPKSAMHFWEIEPRFFEHLQRLAQAQPGHRHERLLSVCCFASQAVRAGFIPDSKARIEETAERLFAGEKRPKYELDDCWNYSTGILNVNLYPAELAALRTIEEEKFWRSFTGNTCDFESALAAKNYLVASRMQQAGLSDPSHALRFSDITNAIADEALRELKDQQILDKIERLVAGGK